MILSIDSLPSYPLHLDGHKGTVVIPPGTPKPEVRVGLFSDVDADDVRFKHRLREHLDILHRESAAGGRVATFEDDRVCPRVLSVGDGGVVPARVRDARSVAGIVIVDVSGEVSERAAKGSGSVERGDQRSSRANLTHISLRITLELFGLPVTAPFSI